MSNVIFFGENLLSKVIEENAYLELLKHGVTEDLFVTNTEKEVFRFIADYASTNRNNMPDPDTVMMQIEEFIMKYDIQDSYEFMIKQLKSYKIKQDLQNWLNNEGAERFKELDGMAWVKLATNQFESITNNIDYRQKVGSNLATDVKEYIHEYKNRKEGKSFKVWKSGFSSMPNYLSGNMYSWFGRSGRGKSVLVSCVEAVSAAMQGATVLIWAMEQSKYEVMSRIFAHLSFLQESNKDNSSGFEIGSMLKGEFKEIDEEEFLNFLRNISNIMPGKIIVRAVDDEDFTQRSCTQLQADILQTKADVVIIDPIYYMDMEPNTAKVAGGDVANTSKKLRRLCGSYNVVLHVLTQADEVKDDTNDDGLRELRVPKRAEVMKTKAILQDATNLFGIDTCDGKFRIEIGKGRNGGEGEVIEGIFLPGCGVVFEPVLDDIFKEIEAYGF